MKLVILRFDGFHGRDSGTIRPEDQDLVEFDVDFIVMHMRNSKMLLQTVG